jgi:hypothetical protein
MKIILKITALTALLLMFAGITISCNKKNENTFLEKGLYIEVEPLHRKASKIHFIDDEKLVIMRSREDTEGYDQDEFMYKISRNTIELTSVVFPEHGANELFFRVINHRRFEIGYIHFRAGPDSLPNMIFEKQEANTN